MIDKNAVLSTLTVLLLAGIQQVKACEAGKTLLKTGGLTGFHKKLILDLHNHYRSAVALGHIHGQPMAQNMLELKWDDELAAKAQQWAEQCKIAHDPNRHIGRFLVGQNIAATWTTRHPLDFHDGEPDFAEQINKWFAEVKNYGIGRTGFSDRTGHYSQLVWSETSLVGCGFSFFFDPTRGYTKIYVCNYGPGGNVVGSIPYHIGSPSCLSFGLVPSANYPGLCDANFRGYLSNFVGKK